MKVSLPQAFDQVTFIILSCERQHFIRRQLLYLSDYPIEVLIADGSSRSWPHGSAGTVGSASWRYLHKPGLATYAKRLVEALRQTTTDYVTIVDDQDGHLVSGVMRSVQVLSLHPETSLAGGLVASSLDSLAPKYVVRWGYLSNPLDVTDLPIVERLATTWSSDRLANFCYQVYRTKDFVTLLEGLDDLTWDHVSEDWTFLEVIYCIFFSLVGSFQMMNFPYWIRSGDSVPHPNRFFSGTEEQLRVVTQSVLASAADCRQARGLHPLEVPGLAGRILSILTQGRSSPSASRSEKFKKRVMESLFLAKTFSLLSSCLRLISRSSSVTWRFNWNFGIPFSDLPYLRHNGTPEELLDIERLLDVWNTYPTGVDEERFHRIIHS